MRRIRELVREHKKGETPIRRSAGDESNPNRLRNHSYVVLSQKTIQSTNLYQLGLAITVS